NSVRHGRSAEPGRAGRRARRKETHPVERSLWFPDCAAGPGRAHFRRAQTERTNGSSIFRRVRAPTRVGHPDISLTLLWSLACAESEVRDSPWVGSDGEKSA